jgi:hypothetical protein
MIVILAATPFATPRGFNAGPSPAAAAPQPNIEVNGSFAADKVQRGRTVQARVVVDIPGGFHINANRLLGKVGVPTTVKVEAPRGVRVGPVIYPRPVVRKLKVSEERLALYEGRAVFRFNVTVPAGFKEGTVEVRAIFRFTVNVAPGAEQQVARVRVSVRFQSCNDEVCFPPTTREVTMQTGVR